MAVIRSKVSWVLWLWAFVASASVVRIETSHTATVGHGYQRLTGRAYFAVDPRHPRNRDIVDISLAPGNEAGMVEFSADFEMLRPIDPSRSNRTLLFEVVNRGKKSMLQMFNRSGADDLGDGMLMEQGYTLVWLGWQHDVPPSSGLMRLSAPAARGAAGRVRAEYTPNAPVDHFSLGDAGHVPYKAVSLDKASLTVRKDVHGPREPLPPGTWSIENGTYVRLSAPAVPGHIYEVVYEASDPVVAGLGLAGIRDLISHLRREEHLDNAIAFGISQSGMVLRALLYEGFNQDEQGAKVFDGVFTHVAGARRSTFQRFTQPSRTAGPRRNASLSTTELPPYTDAEVLSRTRNRSLQPKIFVTNSTYEYWGSGASLLHTTLDGSRDVVIPKNIRMYVFAGGQHGPAAFPPPQTGAVNLPNFNDYRWSVRALLAPLRAWVVSGTEPPPSMYPTIKSGTLVTLDRYRFNAAQAPREIHTPALLDFGPGYPNKGIITTEPPRVLRRFVPLVPQADIEGNDLGGIRMPEVACPIAAYTGWNLRGEEIGSPGSLLGNTGSYLPFEVTKIRQRFATERQYLSCVEAASKSLVDRRLLLERDVPKLIDSALRHWSWRMDVRTTSAIQRD
ncbi:MAG TPA: alpha/beta hydrolase domain-containing protein [Bryobacteraceae bacterium]|nr:alpha/beta hydrolase domain-containing protein [Bryobacteraceae bacterium]